MKAEKQTIQKIKRDLFISLFLYALPLLLMLLSFTISGQKPWKNKVNITHAQTK